MAIRDKLADEGGDLKYHGAQKDAALILKSTDRHTPKVYHHYLLDFHATMIQEAYESYSWWYVQMGNLKECARGPQRHLSWKVQQHRYPHLYYFIDICYFDVLSCNYPNSSGTAKEGSVAEIRLGTHPLIEYSGLSCKAWPVGLMHSFECSSRWEILTNCDTHGIMLSSDS
eukprot:IDg4325t1